MIKVPIWQVPEVKKRILEYEKVLQDLAEAVDLNTAEDVDFCINNFITGNY